MSKTTLLLGVATTAATIITAYVFQKRKKASIPQTWLEVGTLKEVNIYPLKSGHRVELQEAECTEFGLKQTARDEKALILRDTILIVYGIHDFTFRSAKTFPKLVLIDVAVHDKNHLSIDAPNMSTLYLRIPPIKKKKAIIQMQCDEYIYTIDCGDDAATWFSMYVLDQNVGLRLGYYDAATRKDITKVRKPQVHFYKNLSNSPTVLYTDLSKLLLICQSSDNDVNQKTDNYISEDNFNPNLVVDGDNLEVFGEGTWEWVKIGEVVFRTVEDCKRCIMAARDPETDTTIADSEHCPNLRTSRIRSLFHEPIRAMYLDVQETGKISLGDKVFVAPKNVV